MNKIVKTVDEHNIDRDANVMFAFDLEGSEYVSYRISRDDEQDNLFVSKVLKNLDGTYNMVNVDDISEKNSLNSIVMSLVESAVKNPADKLSGDSLSLSDGKMLKFISVGFNKEQRIEVRKTYVTTVKKEVSRVAERYYDVVSIVEQPKVVEEVFPTVAPVIPDVQEVVKPEVVVAVPEPVVDTVVTPTPVVSTPVVETPVLTVPVIEVPSVESPVVTTVPSVTTPEVVSPVAPVPTVVETITVPESPVSVETPTPAVVAPVQEVSTIQPTPVIPTPVVVAPEPVSAVVSNEAPSLIFDASKETNLNAALGEVASAETIPVENIVPVREFGVEEPVQTIVNPQPAVASMVQPEITAESEKAGFANSKFFMLVAVAFFLASCIFLGYEVFNYFQLTK